MNVFICCYLERRLVARYECELFQAAQRVFEVSRCHAGLVSIEAIGHTWATLRDGKLLMISDTPDCHRSYALDLISELTEEVLLIDAELNPKRFPVDLKKVLT